MRKLIITVILAGILALSLVAPAFADAGGAPPCGNPGQGSPAAAGAVDPGHAGPLWFGKASGKCVNTL